MAKEKDVGKGGGGWGEVFSNVLFVMAIPSLQLKCPVKSVEDFYIISSKTLVQTQSDTSFLRL